MMMMMIGGWTTTFGCGKLLPRPAAIQTMQHDKNEKPNDLHDETWNEQQQEFVMYSRLYNMQYGTTVMVGC